MADTEKADEEQVVRDTDADVEDVADSAKGDEEQVVRDTDADTRNVDSRLNEMYDYMQRMNGTLTRVADIVSTLSLDSVIIDTPEPDEDDGVSHVTDDFDLSIDGI